MTNSWHRFYVCAIATLSIALSGAVFAMEKQPESLQIFNGKPRLLIVHGYSTSATGGHSCSAFSIATTKTATASWTKKSEPNLNAPASNDNRRKKP